MGQGKVRLWKNARYPVTHAHVPTLYLDTSVIGGYFDEEWQRVPTQKLWRLMEAGRFRFVTSEVTLREISRAPQPVQRLFARVFPIREELLEITDEMEDLADVYIRHGILTEKYGDDALHVAACTVARIGHLVSWNFKHLVNVQRRAAFNGVNLLQGYSPVSIVTPQEFIYDDQNAEKV